MNRSQIVQCPSFTVMLDAYNANPSSMKATIGSLNQQEYGRMAFVLGDMFELGDHALEQHRELGRIANASKAERVIAIGNHMKFALEELKDKQTWWYESAEKAAADIASHCEDMDFVLIKGSRGMALERLMKELKPEQP
jgi:UDP-N-acetylmuramoyl-tripeptide--D-alanyl-D-alanine ligase